MGGNDRFGNRGPPRFENDRFGGRGAGRGGPRGGGRGGFNQRGGFDSGFGGGNRFNDDRGGPRGDRRDSWGPNNRYLLISLLISFLTNPSLGALSSVVQKGGDATATVIVVVVVIIVVADLIDQTGVMGVVDEVVAESVEIVEVDLTTEHPQRGRVGVLNEVVVIIEVGEGVIRHHENHPAVIDLHRAIVAGEEILQKILIRRENVLNGDLLLVGTRPIKVKLLQLPLGRGAHQKLKPLLKNQRVVLGDLLLRLHRQFRNPQALVDGPLLVQVHRTKTKNLKPGVHLPKQTHQLIQYHQQQILH